MTKRETLLDRFVRYVKIETASSETSTSQPSTEGQWNLARILVEDLKEAGLLDAEVDEHCYVMATLPSNIPNTHPSYNKVPAIGLLGHLDTFGEVSGKDVKPQIHKNYDGKDIVLPGDPSVVLRIEEEKELAKCRGLTIITSDGTTLLGADDKAGIAEIIEFLWRLKENPSRLHGPIKIGFTPDEEIGNGTLHFDVKKFGAKYAYTIDGGVLGEIEDETFCADSAFVTITGADSHPGMAKGNMINSHRVAADFIMSLPQDRTPETTEDREGFLHPYIVQGDVSKTKITFLVRDFTVEVLQELENIIESTATLIQKKYDGVKIDVEFKESYRNMKETISKDYKVVEYAEEAMKRLNITPIKHGVRGGTDGARLSFMGVLTPNLFAGGVNMHSKKEWVPLEWMEKSVETLLNLIDVWAEKSV